MAILVSSSRQFDLEVSILNFRKGERKKEKERERKRGINKNLLKMQSIKFYQFNGIGRACRLSLGQAWFPGKVPERNWWR